MTTNWAVFAAKNNVQVTKQTKVFFRICISRLLEALRLDGKPLPPGEYKLRIKTGYGNETGWPLNIY